MAPHDTNHHSTSSSNARRIHDTDADTGLRTEATAGTSLPPLPSLPAGLSYINHNGYGNAGACRSIDEDVLQEVLRGAAYQIQTAGSDRARWAKNWWGLSALEALDEAGVNYSAYLDALLARSAAPALAAVSGKRTVAPELAVVASASTVAAVSASAAALPLTAEHLRHLRRSGLHDRTLRAAGVLSLGPMQMREAIGREWRHTVDSANPTQLAARTRFGGIGFPCFNGIVRVRPDQPHPSWDKTKKDYERDRNTNALKFAKYTQRAKVSPPISFAPPSLLPLEQYRTNALAALALTEGEKKLLLLAQCAAPLGIAPIGLPGIYNAHDASYAKQCAANGGRKQYRFRSEIAEHVHFAGRAVFVLFDDYRDKQRKHEEERAVVMQASPQLSAREAAERCSAKRAEEPFAAQRIADMCYDAGAREVRFSTPPPGSGKGVDDAYVHAASGGGGDYDLDADCATTLNHAAGVDAIRQMLNTAMVMGRTRYERDCEGRWRAVIDWWPEHVPPEQRFPLDALQYAPAQEDHDAWSDLNDSTAAAPDDGPRPQKTCARDQRWEPYDAAFDHGQMLQWDPAIDARQEALTPDCRSPRGERAGIDYHPERAEQVATEIVRAVVAHGEIYRDERDASGDPVLVYRAGAGLQGESAEQRHTRPRAGTRKLKPQAFALEASKYVLLLACSDDGEPKPIAIPQSMVHGLYDKLAEAQLPVLRATADCAIYTTRGVHRKGYEPHTGVHVVPRDAVEPVPAAVSGLAPEQIRADMRAALEQLSDWLSELSYADEAARHSVVALALTIAARFALGRRIPAWAITSAQIDSGKSLAVDALSIGMAARMPYTIDPPTSASTAEERYSVRKALLEAAAASVVMMDEVEPGRTLASPVLQAVLTAGAVSYQRRTLQYQPVTCLAGVRLRLGAALAKRCIPIDLAPGNGHTHPRRRHDLIASTAAERPQLLAAAFTLLTGRSELRRRGEAVEVSVLGDFPAWSHLVLGAMADAGAPVALIAKAYHREREQAIGESREGQLMDALLRWRSETGDTRSLFTATELAAAAAERCALPALPGDPDEALRRPYLHDVLKGTLGHAPNQHSLKRVLPKLVGLKANGWQLGSVAAAGRWEATRYRLDPTAMDPCADADEE